MSLDRYYCDDPQVMSLESPNAPEDMKGQWVLAEDAEAEIAAKDEALRKAIDSLEGWKLYTEVVLDDNPEADIQWPIVDDAALTACREAMKGDG